MEYYSKFDEMELNLGRVMALVDLISACKTQNVEIKKVFYFQNGFSVIFKGLSGDAILHDNSYGRLTNEWETFLFPWDKGDTSVHDSETLAKLLGALKRREDWKRILKPEKCDGCEFYETLKCIDCGMDDDDLPDFE